MNKNLYKLAAYAGAVAIFSGCVQTRQTEPKRTAVEQMLLSRSVDHAMDEVDFTPISGKKVYLEQKYIKAEDQEYLISAIRDKISTSGAMLVDAAADAEMIVEGRSGALSIDSGSSLVGLPELPVPIPLSGTIKTPELYLYKVERQYSTTKVALFAYDAKTRVNAMSTGPLYGESHNHYYKILGMIKWTSTDLPSKKSSYTGD